MAGPALGYLKYRVLNQNTGAVVIQDLPHLHQSKWTVRALIAGVPGAATIGDFSIPLFPPTMEEGKRYFNGSTGIYDQLLISQRIEGFLGDTLTGTPAFTGIIHGFDKPLDGPWVLKGFDSLFLLQQSQLTPGEFVEPLLDFPNIIRSTHEVVWDDDFSLWNTGTHPNSSDYTASGFSFTASDPNLSLPALTSTTLSPTIARVVTTTTWAAGSQFQGSTVTITGSMQPGTDTVSEACEAGVLLLSDATAQNGILCRARMIGTGATSTYDIFAEIFTIASGTYTQQASVKAFSALLVTGAFFYQVTAVLDPRGFVHVLVNGQDPGASFSTGGLTITSGGIGLRFSPASGGSPQVWVNRITFRSRPVAGVWGTPRFAAGSLSAASSSKTITSSAQTHLDLLQMTLVLNGAQARKNAGFGFKSDSIDAATGLGTDHSSSIAFREGENVVAQGTMVSTVGELFATDVRFNSIPGVDTGGSIVWSRIGQIGDMVLTDSVADVGLPGALQQMLYSELLQLRKVNPLQATQVTIARTAEVCAPEQFRELDSVLVDIPTLGLHRLKEQVVGFTFTEGDPNQTVWLATFPALDQLRGLLGRISRPVEFLTQTYKQR